MLSVPLRPERYSEAARTLARAYLDDPALAWVLPDRARREDRLRWLFERRIRAIAPAGACAITSGSEGVALWVPPDPGGGAWPSLGPGLAVSSLTLGAVGAARLAGLERTLRRRHRRLVREPHWIFLALGVEPRSQRDGVGRALLESGIQRADESGQPALLVTHNPRSLELFAAWGFEIVADAPLGRGGPMSWTMRRAAQPR